MINIGKFINSVLETRCRFISVGNVCKEKQRNSSPLDTNHLILLNNWRKMPSGWNFHLVCRSTQWWTWNIWSCLNPPCWMRRKNISLFLLLKTLQFMDLSSWRKTQFYKTRSGQLTEDNKKCGRLVSKDRIQGKWSGMKGTRSQESSLIYP